MNYTHLFSGLTARARYAGKWFLLSVPVALVTGSLVAFFLWLLDKVTVIRWRQPWLLYLLPLAGVVIYYLYRLWGKDAERGNNLLIDEIHQPGGGVPARMAPLILFTTVITHLFGGSAGREGTAVQMGGSIAAGIARLLRLTGSDNRTLLMMGIAAGFGAVFGTPVAGAVFAMEVLTIGRVKYDRAIPCIIAAIMGHITCLAWGIHHTAYTVSYTPVRASAISFLTADISMLFRAAIAGIAFGICSYLFAASSHTVRRLALRYIRLHWLIPVAGGIIVIALTWMAGSRDYLGLGVSTPQGTGASIVNAFHNGGVSQWSWLWKMLFTIVTLSLGFKGGEVTPLFFIGAALGNTLSVYLHVPADLFAALGFIAVFAGATNTPLACTLMGVELFGADHLLLYAIACFTAYLFSGHKGIYTAQRAGQVKGMEKEI